MSQTDNITSIIALYLYFNVSYDPVKVLAKVPPFLFAKTKKK